MFPTVTQQNSFLIPHPKGIVDLSCIGVYVGQKGQEELVGEVGWPDGVGAANGVGLANGVVVAIRVGVPDGVGLPDGVANGVVVAA